MSGISGQIPGVSGLPIGCPNGNPEYPDIYPEYPMKRCSNVFPRDLWLATCDHVAAIQHIFLLLVTTGKPTYAECQVLCWVQNLEHSAKELFVECPPKSTRWTTGTQRNKSLPSAGQLALGKAALCRVLACGHSAKPIFAECLKKTLGKERHVHRTRP